MLECINALQFRVNDSLRMKQARYKQNCNTKDRSISTFLPDQMVYIDDLR